MVIRPLTAVYAMGEMARPASFKGEKSGPATIFGAVADSASFGEQARAASGLYSGRPLFKIMGTVELMSEDGDAGTDAGFAERPILL